jgi:hypothetical protein
MIQRTLPQIASRRVIRLLSQNRVARWRHASSQRLGLRRRACDRTTANSTT